MVIEIQVSSMKSFGKRVVYNVAKGYANQLKTSDNYIRLKPVMAVTITDFILFKKAQEIINKFVLKEEIENFKCLDEELRLVFVELPKFKKKLSELESLADKWIYFLKEASSFDEIPPSLGEASEIELALNLANQAGMSPEELEIAQSRAMALQDERGKITFAKEEGRKEGRKDEAIALIIRQLKKRFGEINRETISKIGNLTIE